MRKNWRFFRQRASIYTAISIPTLLISGGMLTYFLMAKQTWFTNLGLYIMLGLAFVGFISFGIGGYYQGKEDRTVKDEMTLKKEKDYKRILDLIKSNKPEEALRELVIWKKTYEEESDIGYNK